MRNVLGRYVDPIDVLFAIFFSILFALLLTMSYSVLIYRGVVDSSFRSGYGQELFIAVLVAVTIWGIVDGVVYVLAAVLARSERYRLLQYVQTSNSDESAVSAIADELDFILDPIINDDQRQTLYRGILEHLQQAEPQPVGLEREDLTAAALLVLISAVAVLPSLLPLLLLPEQTQLAITISNVVSIVVIFITGYFWGIHTSTNPWKIGSLLALICLSLVVFAILLGG